MTNSRDSAFIGKLVGLAKTQATLEKSSPVPEFLRPAFAVVGLSFTRVLLVVSFFLASVIATLTFAFVYRSLSGQ